MLQSEVSPGTRAVVRIGTRFAPVTVLHKLPGKGRARWVCLTDDTRREVRATAARLRPVCGSPEEKAEEGRAVARRAAEERAVEKARAAEENMDKMPLDRDTYKALSRAAAAGNWPSVDALTAHLGQWIERLPGRNAKGETRDAVIRALLADPTIITREGWSQIAAAGRVVSSGATLVAPTAVPDVGLTRVNPSRPVEPLVGVNLSAAARLVARRHAAEPLLTVARAIARSMGGSARRMPVPLRRGLWQTVARLHDSNRAVYRDVMGHDPLPSPGMVADAVGAALGLGRRPS
jgi:hypothetical protein